MTGCLYGQLRLVNGTGPNVGRLEICIQGRWGTVCDDHWKEANAQVVCRQLGYSPDGKIYYWYSCSYIWSCCLIIQRKTTLILGAEFLGRAYFGAGNGSIYLDDVICSGSESTILQCNHSLNGQHNCHHGEDVSVHCSESGI